MTKSTTPQTRANLKSTNAPKREPKPESVDVSTLGRNQTYNGYTFAERGAGYSNPVGPVDNMGVGPGANRDVHRSGSQHGLADRDSGNAEHGDFLNEFGPDVKGMGPGSQGT